MYLDVFYGKHVELPRRKKKKKKKKGFAVSTGIYREQ